MKRIGLLGENENDVRSIVALMRKRFGDGFDYFSLLVDVNGDSIENTEYKNRFRREYEYQRDFEGGVDLVLFIRDLDDFETANKKISKRKTWFRSWSKTINQKGLLLLNIWELEALIWADIEGYNKEYDTNIDPFLDPMQIKEPKEELKKHVKYSEGMSPTIFKDALRVSEVAQNCRYFREFLNEFEKRIA